MFNKCLTLAKGFNKNFKFFSNLNKTANKSFIKNNLYSFSTNFRNVDHDHQSNIFPINVHTISDNYGARKLKKRIGRGPGSGRGKTSTRGHKGFKARVGSPARHFIGGTTPIQRRHPKHGFRRNNIKNFYSYINLYHIVYLIRKGRLDPSKPITIKDLLYSGGITKVKDGVKLLGRGTELLNGLPPLTLEVSSATQQVIDAVKQFGGTVICKYRTPLMIKYHTEPQKFYKDLNEPYVPYTKVKALLNLEDKGAVYIIYII